MRFLAGIGTIAVVSAVSLVPVYGESPTTKEMNTRIKALQERLAGFRQQINTGKRKLEITGAPAPKAGGEQDAASTAPSSVGEPAPTAATSAAADSAPPEQVSDSLESRTDAKVIVLFHDTPAPTLAVRASSNNSIASAQPPKTPTVSNKK